MQSFPASWTDRSEIHLPNNCSAAVPKLQQPSLWCLCEPHSLGTAAAGKPLPEENQAKIGTGQLLSCACLLFPYQWISKFPFGKCQGLANYPQSYPLKMLKSPCLLWGALLCSHGNRNCSLQTLAWFVPAPLGHPGCGWRLLQHGPDLTAGLCSALEHNSLCSC